MANHYGTLVDVLFFFFFGFRIQFIYLFLAYDLLQMDYFLVNMSLVITPFSIRKINCIICMFLYSTIFNCDSESN